ncbi:membrane protein implicated in regulation of membrane protease activity [Anaerobacterium chartisolvens]|uniref:Membrane protein implicated in regulation of membrane protease activity n=1 Tax=Anaerobacterium chartisolvens TaxID=1297424 RepID=A0A369B301_9FIRM|nr:NfeD family protein [Anaerobacterium chartisolvens]RCX14807.1 membrane protein implicated in regulation of membrane protease activity [Anaerobacterium chartisolvens]
MFNEIPYTVLWLIIAIILGIIEVATLGLVTVWFAAGAVVALIAAAFGAPFLVQLIVFTISSGVLLYFTKPIVRKFLDNKVQKTNADRLVGEHGVVIEGIDPSAGTGQVKVGGQIWSARSVDGTPVGDGKRVQVLEISGVKLIVKAVDDKEDI